MFAGRPDSGARAANKVPDMLRRPVVLPGVFAPAHPSDAADCAGDDDLLLLIPNEWPSAPHRPMPASQNPATLQA